jgi:hypothetical protein
VAARARRAATPRWEPVPLGELALALSSASDRDAVARLLVSPVLAAPTLNVLFLVRGELAVALAASDGSFSTPAPALRAEEIQRLTLPIASSPMLREAIGGQLQIGPAASDPMQQVISGFLRAPAPEEACVVPVVMASRVVNLLCVQSPSGSKLPPDSAEKLLQVAALASSAYGQLIRALKSRG